MLHSGASVFAISEALTGLVAVGCIVFWVGYSIKDWEDVLRAKDRAFDGIRGAWTKIAKSNTDAAATAPITQDTNANTAPTQPEVKA